MRGAARTPGETNANKPTRVQLRSALINVELYFNTFPLIIIILIIITRNFLDGIHSLIITEYNQPLLSDLISMNKANNSQYV